MVCRGIPKQEKRTGVCLLYYDFANTSPSAKHTVVLNTDLMNKRNRARTPFIQRLFSPKDVTI